MSTLLCQLTFVSSPTPALLCQLSYDSSPMIALLCQVSYVRFPRAVFHTEALSSFASRQFSSSRPRWFPFFYIEVVFQFEAKIFCIFFLTSLIALGQFFISRSRCLPSVFISCFRQFSGRGHFLFVSCLSTSTQFSNSRLRCVCIAICLLWQFSSRGPFLFASCISASMAVFQFEARMFYYVGHGHFLLSRHLFLFPCPISRRKNFSSLRPRCFSSSTIGSCPCWGPSVTCWELSNRLYIYLCKTRQNA